MEIDLLQATFLALIQGITEFLPISSSAHLLLPAYLLGWGDQGLAFDVAVHLGSLSAVMLYFRGELGLLTRSWCLSVMGRGQNEHSRLAWLLVLATLPVILAGFILKDTVDNHLRSVAIVAGTTIGFALVLWLADRRSTAHRDLQTLTWRTALFIGLAQILALVPGTSRSGITMTAAMWCHLSREAAGRFSFLLSIPVIAGASLLLILDLLQAEAVDWWLLLYATLVSAVVAYACIHYFLKFINTIGFMPFVIYRLVLGMALLILMVF